MTNLFKKVRKEFDNIKKTSKSDSETSIRKRIAIEKIRNDTYLKYYMFSLSESSFMKIMVIFFIVLNILNLFLKLYVNLIIPSIFAICLLSYRLYIKEKSNSKRLDREIHKIKKVLDNVDANQELPVKLVDWYFSSKEFIEEIESLKS